MNKMKTPILTKKLILAVSISQILSSFSFLFYNLEIEKDHFFMLLVLIMRLPLWWLEQLPFSQEVIAEAIVLICKWQNQAF